MLQNPTPESHIEVVDPIWQIYRNPNPFAPVIQSGSMLQEQDQQWHRELHSDHPYQFKPKESNRNSRYTQTLIETPSHLQQAMVFSERSINHTAQDTAMSIFIPNKANPDEPDFVGTVTDGISNLNDENTSSEAFSRQLAINLSYFFRTPSWYETLRWMTDMGKSLHSAVMNALNGFRFDEQTTLPAINALDAFGGTTLQLLYIPGDKTRFYKYAAGGTEDLGRTLIMRTDGTVRKILNSGTNERSFIIPGAKFQWEFSETEFNKKSLFGVADMGVFTLTDWANTVEDKDLKRISQLGDNEDPHQMIRRIRRHTKSEDDISAVGLFFAKKG